MGNIQSDQHVSAPARHPRLNELAEGFEDAFAGVRALGLPTTDAAGEDGGSDPSAAARDARDLSQLLSPAVAVFAVAAVARAIVLLFVTGPEFTGVGWYHDTIHHWQIAFLSKEIGFQNGFLRLWDFKGLEYFWGAAHPFLTAALFTLTGSIDVLIPRLLGLVTGSVAIGYLYLSVERHFGRSVAISAALFAAFNPVLMVSDTAGIQEPIGLMFLFSALYYWPSHALRSGVLFGLAGTVRAEYWVFGLGLVVVSFLVDRREYKNFSLLLGWVIPSAAYMKYLATYTGNPIYPVYWYYRGDAAGEWMGSGLNDPAEVVAIWVSRILLPLFVAAALLVLRKRPHFSLFALLGLGEMIFICIVFGFTAFVSGFSPRILLDRILALPHIYTGVLIGIGLGHAFPRRGASRSPGPLWATVLVGLIVAGQALWIGVWHYHSGWEGFWLGQYESAARIADLYQGGVVSIPEDRPEYTYFLARYHGVPAKGIQGQMYDAFAYIEGDPFADYATTEPRLRNWLVGNDIRLLVTYSHDDTYREMIARSPGWFTRADTLLNGAIEVYYVHPSATSNNNTARETDIGG